MKFWISLFALALMTMMVGTAAYGTTVALTLETKMFSSEAAAIKDAKKVSAEINAARNADAIADATLECPEENAPTFRVNWVRIVAYLIPSGADFDKRYAAMINYELRCKTRG
jgi:hypothetical protein